MSRALVKMSRVDGSRLSGRVCGEHGVVGIANCSQVCVSVDRMS